MCQRFLLIDFILLIKCYLKILLREVIKTAEGHNISPLIVWAKVLPENIWPTVTGAYTFSRTTRRALPSINHPVDPKKY